MSKKAAKGVALPIDWNIFPPDSSIIQGSKRPSRHYISHSEKHPEVGVASEPPKHMYDRGETSTPTTLNSRVQESEEAKVRPLKSVINGHGGRDWIPDIYVHAFVPESLSAVNRSSASLISTPAVDGIDFGKYISTFAGNQFLSELESPQVQEMSGTAIVGDVDHLTPSNYGRHFEECLALDLQGQVPEIRSYDLFGVVLEVLDAIQQIYSLKVHGLREGTPSVSLGDTVLLRQLILDPVTRLPHGMKAWLAPGGGFARGIQAPGFTGYEISAVVLAIDRIEETLLLRAHGLILAGNPVCNVSFVVQAPLIMRMQRAVMISARQLSQEDTFTEPTNISSDPTEDFIGKVGPLCSGTVTELGTVITSKGYENTSATPPVGERTHPSPDKHVNARAKNRWLQHVLFPEEANGVIQNVLPSAVFPQNWYDKLLNYEQKKAVNAVQSRNYGEFCYLINGPPGTGKTKTVCEIVIQLGKDRNFIGSILLCAPSNPAADTLALRLKPYFEPKSLLRLNHFSRTFAEVPQELLPYCYVKDDIFNLPPMSKLMEYKIVIATCQAADILVQARVTNCDMILLQNGLISAINPGCQPAPAPLHWAALLIDEAAQATEPECLIPLTVVSPPAVHPDCTGPLFAMAGDQHQLSPRTYHDSTTLHVSLFERLSKASVYASHPLARKTLHRTLHHAPMLRPPFVNLIRNYRSHPAILAVPSSLFYENTLIPEASQTDSLLPWSVWRGRKWPLLFACNGGMDQCEDIRGVGGGWYNTREATKAVAYVRELLAQTMVSDQSEICIMSPFPAQVHLLRRLARHARLWDVNIGPVEAFQGLESRFVIVCTTRARRRFLDEDNLRGIGIVREKKKFNVAITRAKEGLIVLGNPWVLATDPCWLAFMQFCWRNCLWQGEDKDLLPQDPEKDVNEWRPLDQLGHPVGLEAALVFRGRDKSAGSQATMRFMNGSESAEDALWRSGLEAEEALDVSRLDISDRASG